MGMAVYPFDHIRCRYAAQDGEPETTMMCISCGLFEGCMIGVPDCSSSNIVVYDGRSTPNLHSFVILDPACIGLVIYRNESIECSRRLVAKQPHEVLRTVPILRFL